MSRAHDLAPNGSGIAFAAFADTHQVACLLGITLEEAFKFQDQARNDFELLQKEITRARPIKP